MNTSQQRAKTTPQKRLRMSYEDYLEWATEDTRAEWIDGEVIVYMLPKLEHQRIVGFLHQLLALFVTGVGRGVVYPGPFEVKLWPNGPAREPDVFYLSPENLDILSSDRVAGPPDLVVEVLSPDTIHEDRSSKFREYERAGVREYWIVDSRPGDNQRADFYRLDESDRFDLFATDADDVVNSTVLDGFWLRPEWLWQDPTPNPLQVLADVVGRDTLVDVLDGSHEVDTA